MNHLQSLIDVLACTVVIAACICRVDKMRASSHSWCWFAVYALFAAYAAGTALASWNGSPMSWDDTAGIGGLLLYMALTRRLWRDGPPSEIAKG